MYSVTKNGDDKTGRNSLTAENSFTGKRDTIFELGQRRLLPDASACASDSYK